MATGEKEPQPGAWTRSLRPNAEFQLCKPPVWLQFSNSNRRIYTALFLWLPLSSSVVRKACTNYTSLHNTYWQCMSLKVAVYLSMDIFHCHRLLLASFHPGCVQIWSCVGYYVAIKQDTLELFFLLGVIRKRSINSGNCGIVSIRCMVYVIACVHDLLVEVHAGLL